MKGTHLSHGKLDDDIYFVFGMKKFWQQLKSMLEKVRDLNWIFVTSKDEKVVDNNAISVIDKCQEGLLSYAQDVMTDTSHLHQISDLVE